MTTEEVQDVFEGVNPEPTPAPVLVDPPQSRFLYVDVAALRAKQLRRGALPRLNAGETHLPLKAERIAMEEVRRGLVGYDLPEFRNAEMAEQQG
jgi:DNA-directed RNA polymerase subunit K/omega